MTKNKKSKEYRYLIRDHQAGNVIEHARTLNQAKAILTVFEEEDKANGDFEENFYEIYDNKTEEVVYY